MTTTELMVMAILVCCLAGIAVGVVGNVRGHTERRRKGLLGAEGEVV